MWHTTKTRSQKETILTKTHQTVPTKNDISKKIMDTKSKKVQEHGCI
jgi:hypothetical protein